MNILVYDVAAEKGGAASIVEYFYQKHLNDKSNHYYYLLSTYQLDEAENITVINIPSIKKSWFHRIVFDYIGSRDILKKYHIDQVISLQNLSLPSYKGRQVVYVHNALPFSEYRFGILEDTKLWVYQNIIGLLMYKSIKMSDKVIVQTEWMKKAVIEQCGIEANKIEVDFPEVYVQKTLKYNYIANKNIFFYPANESIFKNHKIIIDACKILISNGCTNFEVVFTLNGNENDDILKIRNEAEKSGINVKWEGVIPRQKVFEWYEKSVLLFPSYIETIGLPIYEAMQVGTPIIITTCEYAQSIAKEYPWKKSFKYNNANQLAEIMLDMCQNSNLLV